MAFTVTAVLVIGILFALYFVFARAWLFYHAEQALYCVAEERPGKVCRESLMRNLRRFLPWGDVQLLALDKLPAGAVIRMRWRIKEYSLPVHRKLDLSWSRRSRFSPSL